MEKFRRILGRLNWMQRYLVVEYVEDYQEALTRREGLNTSARCWGAAYATTFCGLRPHLRPSGGPRPLLRLAPLIPSAPMAAAMAPCRQSPLQRRPLPASPLPTPEQARQCCGCARNDGLAPSR
jgi:hypothetical protein